jgi:hypothetical protein
VNGEHGAGLAMVLRGNSSSSLAILLLFLSYNRSATLLMSGEHMPFSPWPWPKSEKEEAM